MSTERILDQASQKSRQQSRQLEQEINNLDAKVAPEFSSLIHSLGLNYLAIANVWLNCAKHSEQNKCWYILARAKLSRNKFSIQSLLLAEDSNGDTALKIAVKNAQVANDPFLLWLIGEYKMAKVKVDISSELNKKSATKNTQNMYANYQDANNIGVNRVKLVSLAVAINEKDLKKVESILKDIPSSLHTNYLAKLRIYKNLSPEKISNCEHLFVQNSPEEKKHLSCNIPS